LRQAWPARKKRGLSFAHRRELVKQSAAKLYDHGVDSGIIQAGFPTRPEVPFQVASVQTFWARAMRSSAIEKPAADLVVVDEAHHATAHTYAKIIEGYPGAVILGLTATPCRSDGRGLGNAFDCLIECPSVQTLIDLGFLVPTKVFAPTIPDLDGVKVDHSDYVEAQLAERMDKPQLTGDIVAHWHRLAERRKTVVFATNVEHSVHLRDEFQRSGVWAEHIDASTQAEDRDRILADLAAGRVEVVTNCAVLTEGWDSPCVGCIILARPTKSMGLYRQMVGRVIRPYEGKSFALVLDHAGATLQHGFVEEPVLWTLDPDKRAVNPVHSARSQAPGQKLTTCPECDAIRMAGKPCTACGWKPRVRGKAIDVAEGELGHYEAAQRRQANAFTFLEREKFHGQLLWIAQERGYAKANGWAAHKYKEKFKDWPSRSHVAPVEPDPAVRSWVRSRQIAYAKAMEKRRAA
jgi:DNA repair protein RadD